MGKLTVDRLEVAGKRILLRVDFNVPLSNGVIGDDTRIRGALPTIRDLIARKAKVVLASHLGRPKGQPVPALSLRPVAARLEALLGSPVAFSPEISGAGAREAVERLQPGGVLLLENLRFHPGEEANDPEFAGELAALADGFVSDAFGTVHRAHASTTGVAGLFPSAACGYLMAKELQFLGMALHHPTPPFVAVIGGAKVGDKIQLLHYLLGRCDRLIIGGAMAYIFLHAQGHSVGDSLLDKPHLGLARELLEEAAAVHKPVLLPLDHLVAHGPRADAVARHCGVDIPAGEMGLDIGPKTVQSFVAALEGAGMIVWNGPMGMCELPAFSKGTLALAQAMAASKAVTIVGGGDSIAAVNQAGLAGRISHISTGGGAALQFLEGKKLPGLEVLTEIPNGA